MKTYDKYKDSGIAWIGKIPEHWEIKALKRFSSIKTGTTPPTKDDSFYDSEDINWFTPGDFNSYNLADSNRKLSQKAKDSGVCKIFPKQTIYMVGIGATIGKIATFEDEASANQQINAITVDNQTHYKFIAYCLLSQKEEILLTANIVTLPIINQNKTGSLMIPYPPFSEQIFIASYLDRKCADIDKVISTQKHRIELLQELKQSTITNAVTHGLNPSVKMKDSGVEWIGKIPEHWNVIPMKRLLSKALMYGANESAEDDDQSNPRYIRITDIDDNGQLRDSTFKSLPLDKAKDYLLNKGDILFARSGATVGKTYLFNENYKACFAGYLIKAICKLNKLIPRYLIKYTQSGVYDNWKNSIFIQATIQNIGADKYSYMPIIVPPLSEQQAIASYLDKKCSEIDIFISKAQKEIALLQEYKQSVITEVVTGKRKIC